MPCPRRPGRPVRGTLPVTRCWPESSGWRPGPPRRGACCCPAGAGPPDHDQDRDHRYEQPGDCVGGQGVSVPPAPQPVRVAPHRRLPLVPPIPGAGYHLLQPVGWTLAPDPAAGTSAWRANLRSGFAQRKGGPWTTTRTRLRSMGYSRDGPGHDDGTARARPRRARAASLRAGPGPGTLAWRGPGGGACGHHVRGADLDGRDRTPGHPSHEVSGVVAGLGENARGLPVGEQV